MSVHRASGELQYFDANFDDSIPDAGLHLVGDGADSDNLLDLFVDDRLRHLQLLNMQWSDDFREQHPNCIHQQHGIDEDAGMDCGSDLRFGKQCDIESERERESDSKSLHPQ